tara:strand:+ start:378 stop:752 length:375 start_codon:yes stop_codon:yes gene_type:complete
MKQTIEIDLQYQLEYMDEAELLHAWQIRCDELNYMDDLIYEMCQFDEMMDHWRPMDIAFRVHFGNFNPHHDFFKFNGYANFESSNYLSDFIDLEELADEIMDNDDLADELVNAGLLEEWRNEDE